MPRSVVLLVGLFLATGLVVASLPVAIQRENRAAASSEGYDADGPPSATLRAAPLADRDGAADARDLCEGTTDTLLTRSGFCTHGPDPAPPGFDVDLPVAPLPAWEARLAAEAIACDDDGQSGFRIQILYVYAADVASRYERFRHSLQGWAADADDIFQESAAETGGSRSLRFVQTPDCRPAVVAVQVSPAGDNGFDRTIAELSSLGHNRRDRIYLTFVDTTAAGICGIGTSWSDDRASGSVNRNNIGPAYARVDAGCWGGDIAAHELMHTMGGVQHSAPNASGGFHCTDEWDLMCYQDGPSAETRIVCPNRSRDAARFDCNHDDYFHTSPPPGSYLATHWNAANNRFLIGAPSPAVDSGSSPKVKKKSGKNDKKKGKGGKNKGGKQKRR